MNFHTDLNIILFKIFFLESRVTEYEHVESVPKQSMLNICEGKC